MKPILRIIILLPLIFISVQKAFSQGNPVTGTVNKDSTISFHVAGACEMCKDRIEKAAIKTKGVKSAVWDVQTHLLSLIFDERKTNISKIEESVAAVGHDTKGVTATDEAYNSIHPCCKYRDEEVKKDHE